ncbi:hypothetical protein EVAR_73228_1 [Eumeta japonica]|uniref:Uncharacterized protein n=1 Tax=Eumeta variegata TaxID=151549 RepID=A0A4C1SD53_EUMVA|nr:hypothetical protein EVAR_73228_1 [Eumeta japonica]
MKSPVFSKPYMPHVFSVRITHACSERLETFKRPVEFAAPTIQVEIGRSDCEKGNLFADHLKTVFTQNACAVVVDLPSIVSSPPHPVTFEFREVQNVIANLNPKKAGGIDGISNRC